MRHYDILTRENDCAILVICGKHSLFYTNAPKWHAPKWRAAFWHAAFHHPTVNYTILYILLYYNTLYGCNCYHSLLATAIHIQPNLIFGVKA